MAHSSEFVYFAATEGEVPVRSFADDADSKVNVGYLASSIQGARAPDEFESRTPHNSVEFVRNPLTVYEPPAQSSQSYNDGTAYLDTTEGTDNTNAIGPATDHFGSSAQQRMVLPDDWLTARHPPPLFIPKGCTSKHPLPLSAHSTLRDAETGHTPLSSHSNSYEVFFETEHHNPHSFPLLTNTWHADQNALHLEMGMEWDRVHPGSRGPLQNHPYREHSQAEMIPSESMAHLSINSRGISVDTPNYTLMAGIRGDVDEKSHLDASSEALNEQSSPKATGSPEDVKLLSNLLPDVAVPIHTSLSMTMDYPDVVRGTVAGPALVGTSTSRRKNPNQQLHYCELCPATFTARHNLKSE
ncbi:hypothetical protein VKT23_004861 [Stygiomarasmius scandens]|uniref:C2H2-type domain-containing protein n=1 Tax=Marasmiellus scandens TaxID=2682957 RepID=A0ABR1JSB4_9AGAR